MSCNYSPAASSSYTSSYTSGAAPSITSSISTSSFTSSLYSAAASSTLSSNLTSTFTSSFTSTLTSSDAANIPSTFTTITISSSTISPPPSTTISSSSSSTTSPPTSSTSIPPLSPLPAGSSKCPANFRNTVFNTVATQDSGWSNRWSTLAGMGVSNWSMPDPPVVLDNFGEHCLLTITVGFTLDPISSSPTYNNAPSTPAVDNAQIKICMDPSKVNAALALITGPSPPTYLELFNEPDFSFMGYTPLTDAVSAAAALAPIFSATTTTQFLSPAVAYTNSDWLSTFAAHCNNCMDKIPIISAHVYAADPAAAINQVVTLHATWPSKRIWITELAPASSNDQGCTLDENGVIGWMKTVVPQLVALGYVDRIFWNTNRPIL